MALAYTDLVSIAAHPDFQSRVKFALLSSAIAVYSEAGTVSGHAARATFASRVLANQGFDLPTVALAVLSNATIIAEATTVGPTFGIPDADITFQINAMWNALAGA